MTSETPITTPEPDAPVAPAAPGVASIGETAQRLGRFWTAANLLSLTRLVLVVPITVLVWQGRTAADPLLLGLVGAGILTDFFDGKVARWSGTVSEWGKVLDPIADKAAAICIGAALAFRPDEGYNLPRWLITLTVVRDACILAGAVFLARRGHAVTPSVTVGKLAIGAFALAVLACLLQADAPILRACVLATGALLMLSFFIYAVRFFRLASRAPVADR
jgi:phosphatidylglycerophosphate synthase